MESQKLNELFDGLQTLENDVIEMLEMQRRLVIRESSSQCLISSELDAMPEVSPEAAGVVASLLESPRLRDEEKLSINELASALSQLQRICVVMSKTNASLRNDNTIHSQALELQREKNLNPFTVVFMFDGEGVEYGNITISNWALKYISSSMAELFSKTKLPGTKQNVQYMMSKIEKPGWR